MLYLAEVQKQKSGGVFGSVKAEFKLLACQRGEQNWSVVTADEVVLAEEANSFNPGTLVLVELNEKSKQLQRVLDDSPRKLVSILQNFSKVQERVKVKEEEIEQWKQSLTFQSQELNRREMEMQAREDELAQMNDELDRLDSERQEMESAREELARIRQEVEGSQKEIEAAWAQVRTQMDELNTKQGDLQQAKTLSQDQSQEVLALLERVSGPISTIAINIGPGGTVKESIQLCQQRLSEQQGLLQQYWQHLEEKRAEAQRVEAQVQVQEEELQKRWQDWHQAQEALLRERANLDGQKSVLALKTEQLNSLQVWQNNQDEIYQQVCQIAKMADSGTMPEVDVQAIENMSIDELQRLVQGLQQDLQKVLGFVNDQEEELTMQQETIDELQGKIQLASEYDRLNLETELADEQESYQMLNESLVGSRRNLQKQEHILNVHQSILRRRLGQKTEGQNEPMDLAPVVDKLEKQRQLQGQKLQSLQTEVQQIQQNLTHSEGSLNQQTNDLQARRDEIKQLDTNLRSQIRNSASLWGIVHLYEEMLQPLQNRIDEIRKGLGDLNNGISQMTDQIKSEEEAMTQLRQVLSGVLAE